MTKKDYYEIGNKANEIIRLLECCDDQEFIDVVLECVNENGYVDTEEYIALKK